MDVLDERKSRVLTAVIRDFIRGGEPVGSKRLVEEWDLGVSAATIRAEMAALEEAGYITHPHRSAGRIPTDKGYRFFVDAITQELTDDVTAPQQALLDDLLAGASDLEDLLQRASGALSRLTRFAALVAAPSLDRSRLKHIELVQLSPTTVLAVLIADTGRVTKRLLDLPEPIAEHEVQRARHAVNAAAAGLRASEGPSAIAGIAAGAPPELAPLLDKVAEAVRTGIEEADGRQGEVFLGGAAHLADGQFQRLEQVKLVFETLEEQVVLLKVLQDALASSDPAVRIGGELPLRELEACSVVAASYEGPGEAAGSVGVLGPTRMDYGRTLGAVRAVAVTLERAIGELTGASPRTPPDPAARDAGRSASSA